MVDSARTPSRYNFPHVKPHQFFHPNSIVDVDSTATITVGHIDVGAGGSLIVGPNSEVRDCRIHVAPGAKLQIGSYCRLLGVNILVREDGAAVEIGNYCAFAINSLIMADELIRIGNYVAAAMNVMIVDSSVHSLDWELRQKEFEDWRHGRKVERDLKTTLTIIRNNVWLCYGATIAGAKAGEDILELGKGVVVGANSVVKNYFEEFQLVAGIPAKHLKFLKGSDKYQPGELDKEENPMSPSI